MYQKAILPKTLKPEYSYDLIRFGKDNDGGYLISKKSITESETLISAGISWDFSFEYQYIKETNNKIFCFDHTINTKHYLFTWIGILLNRICTFSNLKRIKSAFNNILKPIKFLKFKKNPKVTYNFIGIGLGDERYMELKDVINKFTKEEKIFLKIDIEGDEYRLIDDVVKLSSRFTGLIIEFHNVDLNLEKIINFVEKVDLKLIHTHINNAGPLNKNLEPTLIECSFASNPEVLGEFENFKHSLDQPNIKNKDDYQIIFE